MSRGYRKYDQSEWLGRLKNAGDKAAPHGLISIPPSLNSEIPQISALRYCHLSELELDALNPRQETSPEDDWMLAESIAELGLLQNLLGRQLPNGRIGIVGGGRRLRALKLLAAEGRGLNRIPVKVASNANEAESWGHAENMSRQDLQPHDEIRAFRRLRRKGHGHAAIARAFGVTEGHVSRRMRLAELPEPVIDALAQKQITYDMAAAFTLSGSEERTIEVLAAAIARSLDVQTVKTLLLGRVLRASDRRVRYVTLEAYSAAGGAVERDLFSEDVFLADEGLVEELFEQKLTAAARSHEAEGWKWVEAILTPGFSLDEAKTLGMAQLQPAQTGLSEAEEYEVRRLTHLRNLAGLTDREEREVEALLARRVETFTEAQMAQSGIILHVLQDGSLERLAGLVRSEDHGSIGAADAAALGEDGTPRIGFSEKLRDDLQAIELAAVQRALAGRLDLLLDLAGFVLSGEGPTRINCVDFRADVPRSPHGDTHDGLTLIAQVDRNAPPGPDRAMKPRGEADMFKIFRGKGEEHRDAALSAGLARMVRHSPSKNGLYALLAREAGANMREIWRPTAENFFRRVKTAYLDRLYVTLVEPQRGDERLKLWRGLKKSEKAELLENLFKPGNAIREAYGLSVDQAIRLDRWTPEGYGNFGR